MSNPTDEIMKALESSRQNMSVTSKGNEYQVSIGDQSFTIPRGITKVISRRTTHRRTRGSFTKNKDHLKILYYVYYSPEEVEENDNLSTSSANNGLYVFYVGGHVLKPYEVFRLEENVDIASLKEFPLSNFYINSGTKEVNWKEYNKQKNKTEGTPHNRPVPLDLQGYINSVGINKYDHYVSFYFRTPHNVKLGDIYIPNYRLVIFNKLNKVQDVTTSDLNDDEVKIAFNNLEHVNYTFWRTNFSNRTLTIESIIDSKTSIIGRRQSKTMSPLIKVTNIKLDPKYETVNAPDDLESLYRSYEYTHGVEWAKKAVLAAKTNIPFTTTFTTTLSEYTQIFKVKDSYTGKYIGKYVGKTSQSTHEVWDVHPGYMTNDIFMYDRNGVYVFLVAAFRFTRVPNWYNYV